MAKKKIYICDNCIYFTDKCEHQSNLVIELHKRIEKIGYKNLKKKTECEHCLIKD